MSSVTDLEMRIQSHGVPYHGQDSCQDRHAIGLCGRFSCPHYITGRGIVDVWVNDTPRRVRCSLSPHHAGRSGGVRTRVPSPGAARP